MYPLKENSRLLFAVQYDNVKQNANDAQGGD